MSGFDDMLAVEGGADGRFRFRFDESWAQGRTAYGGLSASFGVAALERLLDVDGDRALRSIDVGFVGPLAAGDVEVEARVLRAGKNLTHATADVRAANGALTTTVHAIYGRPRASGIAVEPPVARPPAPVGSVEPIPYLPGLTPAFTQHFDMRLVGGAPPFSGAAKGKVQGFARHRTAATGACAVIGLLDAWWAPALSLGSRPFFASSVRWSACFTGDVRDVGCGPDDELLYYESELVAAADGYCTFVANLYAGDRHVAWSEQLVALFDS